jgi:CRP/FNR family transcriptional regulator, cyclic AMP receptor protein
MDGATHTQDYEVGVARAVSSNVEGSFWSGIGAVDEFPFSPTSIRCFRRGEAIKGADVLTDMFARVQRGLVSARTILPGGREFIVEIIPKAGLIGELEVLHGQILDLEYRASSDCKLHFFEGRLLRESCASDPRFQAKVFSRALARVSELEFRIIANAGSCLQSRLASTLLRLSMVYGRDTNNPDELVISQHELAATLPASREKVNQCLRRMRARRVIDGAQGKIHILNRKALEAYAHGAASV